MKTTTLLLFALFPMTISVAQQKYTISGYISDAQNNEQLIGANVYDARTLVGTTTNEYGFFSLTLPSDTIQLTVSFVGYQNQSDTFVLTQDVIKNIALSSSVVLEEVEISATKHIEPIQEQTQMSTVSIPISQVQALPTFLGEVDVLKVLQLMPGVQSGSEGNSGLYVRGGGPDQNLILLDGVPVYNASHLFGFFSVFNSDAINSVQLVKGGFPARYGGRLSSVLDIRMKEGNSQKWGGHGTVGLLSSKFTIEGPIVKNRTSFILSARRTFFDLLLLPVTKWLAEATSGYYFYDINAKINHRFSHKDRLYLSTYAGDDNFYFIQKGGFGFNANDKSTINLGWRNVTGVLRWNHIFSKKVFSNTTLTYSRYQLRNQSRFETTSRTPNGTADEYTFSKYFSSIRDWGAKVDVDYIPNPSHYIKVGVSSTFHHFKPGVTIQQAEFIEEAAVDTSFGTAIDAIELDAYIEDDINITRRFKANIGLHASGFLVNQQLYKSLQPRVSMRYLINSQWSAKASYAQMNQFIHLLTSNSAVDVFNDLWVPTTENIRPQVAHQVAIGVAHTFRDQFEVSVEAYYKTMENLIAYKDGASYLSSSNNWEEKVEIGTGEAYGLELLVQKKVGKTTGWLGYTLAWSNRHFPDTDINFGKPFPYKYDRRHDISLALVHRLSKKVELSANWVFNTSVATTLPLGIYSSANQDGFVNFNTVQHINGRNNFRFRNYHRLDFGASFIKPKKRGERRYIVGLYNAYSRRNPFYMYQDWDKVGNKVFKQLSLFPILPSVAYKRSF